VEDKMAGTLHKIVPKNASGDFAFGNWEWKERVEKLVKIDVVALLQPGEAQLLFGATY